MTFQLELFRADDMNNWNGLDKELELTVGEKERRIGALRQHIKEPGCMPKDHSQGRASELSGILHTGKH